MKNDHNHTPDDAGGDMPRLAAHDFATWGLDAVAYVRPVTVEGKTAFAIHAANGLALGLAGSREAALLAAREHDLEAQSVH